VRTDRLTGLGLTTGDIINAIKAQNVQAAVGASAHRRSTNDLRGVHPAAARRSSHNCAVM